MTDMTSSIDTKTPPSANKMAGRPSADRSARMTAAMAPSGPTIHDLAQQWKTLWSRIAIRSARRDRDRIAALTGDWNSLLATQRDLAHLVTTTAAVRPMTLAELGEVAEVELAILRQELKSDVIGWVGL